MASSHHRPLTAGDRTPPFLLLFLLLVTSRYVRAQSAAPPPRRNPYLANSNSNSNFNPSLAIVIVVLISALLFLGFFSVYIRQWAGLRNADSNSVRGGAAAASAARSRRQHGLDDEVLSSFPTLIYSEVKEHKGALECAVCLSEFEDDETLRLLPKCDHVFHLDCIDVWLASHVTCPVCRSNLVPDNPDKENYLPVPVAADDHSTAAATPVFEHVIEINGNPEGEDIDYLQVQADLERIINMRRAKSRARPVSIPRSYSTGHALVEPGDDLDRFTLRLPDNVRKEVVASGKNLSRARSLAVPVGEGSSRTLFRRGNEGGSGRAIQLGRSDRWPSFLVRTLSTRVPAWGWRGHPSCSSKGGEGSTKG